MQPLVLAVQNAVPVRDMGVATSSSLFFRQMGGTLGTAVFLSILFSTVGDNIAAAFRTAAQTPAFQAARRGPRGPGRPGQRARARPAAARSAATLPSLDDSSFINNLDPRLARPFLDGLLRSRSTWSCSLAACIIGRRHRADRRCCPSCRCATSPASRAAWTTDAADARGAPRSRRRRAGRATAVGGVAAIVADQAAVDARPRVAHPCATARRLDALASDRRRSAGAAVNLDGPVS